MNSNLKVWLSGFLACLAGSAQATDFFCNNYVAANPSAHFQCVETVVGPGAPMILSPDQAGAGPIFASSSSADSGVFAATSSANARANPGLLRGFASAQMLSGSTEGAQAIGRSDAWFQDGGMVVGAAGVPLGTPVIVRFTLNVDGIFGGGGAFTALSEATIDLNARGADLSLVSLEAKINKFNPIRSVTSDVNAFVGETFEMIAKLHVQAAAVNDINLANAMSFADVRNSGHLFVDVLSAGASFVGSSGYVYSTLAPVPEPSESAMLLAGLLSVVAARRRRALTKRTWSGWVASLGTRPVRSHCKL